ncbi:MAG: hypothetical protein EON58_01130 [Alphaproteobacteria bacterium]|nr:MAG: hypothetical protein EON58_01130 [Alphaproteobacteria bacterium]
MAATFFIRLEEQHGAHGIRPCTGARLPIGSEVTEAACKHIIKQRVCGSGMKWRRTTLQSVLSFHERWEQFRTRIKRFGH